MVIKGFLQLLLQNCYMVATNLYLSYVFGYGIKKPFWFVLCEVNGDKVCVIMLELKLM